ncbi:MAG TPA: ABC transporter ATP-binding protein [bacterium]|nr:ABC transporter ATP-binding protein [bacterium]HMW32372.1 ABC transporter ATP-binding protein [bacterium]HMW34861.1 ABC transporter ATP-binding protein [bacterium]HMY35307.1 ABC transporter ATP-binding protein [bacterium]HMZ04659.1 ABC transporter ATP-binding protein [bacterium]
MFKRLKPYLWKYRVYWISGFVLVILKNLFQSTGPQLVREAIDTLAPGTDPSTFPLYNQIIHSVELQLGVAIVVAYIAAYLLVELLHGIFLYLMRQTLIVMSRKIEYDLRSDFFSHLQKLHVQFFQYAKTGDLMSRLTNDLANVREVLGPGIMYTANTIVAFIYVVPMMIHISPMLTLLAFLPLFLLSFAVGRLSGVIMTRSQKVQEKLSDISSAAQENFSGIRVVKSFVQEAAEIKKFENLSHEYIQLNMSMVRIRGIMMSSVILTIGLSVAVLLWYGGSLVIDGVMSIGEFTAFNFYLAMLIWPMVAVGWVINIFQRGSASMKRMNAIFDEQPAISDKNNQSNGHSDIAGKIEFRNLNFSYRDIPVLKNISICIHPGMTLGIVGATGSGKSTLVNLIPRLYDIPDGMLFIDDRDINTIPVSILRQHIGMVTQDNFLFSDTIYQNIVFGVDNPPTDKVIWAVDTAQLRSNIEDFPEKYETIIGERGITLSGGQKQRLSIARAVIREPKILILDDALSSVDTHTEDEILKRLKILMKNRTTLLVSHRIQTVKHADLIIVLKEGAIIETGTHDDLVEQNGTYAAMHERQLLEEEVANI